MTPEPPGPPPDLETKRRQQAALVEDNELVYLGKGPEATGAGGGWSMNPSLLLQCIRCGYYMRADPNTYDGCFCGMLSKDADAARVGSRLGDAAIKVYRAVPRQPGGAGAGG